MTKAGDAALHEALKKAYASRARFFMNRVQESAVESLIEEVEGLEASAISWDDPKSLGISSQAFAKLKNAGTPLHYLFAHSEILKQHPRLTDYYRNLAALSKKGLAQILSGLKYDKAEKVVVVSSILNSIISQIIESARDFKLGLAHSLIFAELGAEIQGSWVNIIGKGAARNVENIIRDHVEKKGYLRSSPKSEAKDKNTLVLKNGWKIVFSSEPDVSILDKKNVLKAAVEIKGSMDKAGAQSRYGEAKKSFAKALAANPRCETIYLASCYTQAVMKQIEADGQVRRTFNLVDILDDEAQRQSFLDEIFKYLVRIE